MMRAPIGLLALAGSFALTSMVVGNAYVQKKQFYPSVVYITKSNPSMAVLYIQAFVFVIILAKLMRKVFFGQLRAVEMEHLIERSWYAVTETCLAFTVFRDDFSTRFVVMFTLLLFLKCFHWLAEDRVDYMESSPLITWLFHIRVLALMTFLGALDASFINHAYHSTLTKGASVQLVFGFEYAILTTVVAAIAIKYVLHVVDLQSEITWDNKAVYLLYTELVVGGVKVLLYSAFMFIMIKVHTFPLFAIRPFYLTLRTFKKALNDVVMSRRAIRNMNNLYPDATEEDLLAGDNVCIICREEMTTGCKKLPCNHIFHTACLRSWFQRQQTCPTCRMDVLRNPRPLTETPPLAQAQPQVQQPPAPNPFAPFQYWPQPGAFPQVVPGATPNPMTSSASPTTPSSSTANNPFAMPPPFMMSPFMMAPPPLPFTTPLPTPPDDFAGLTDEELAAMEGQERDNLEARLKCLRNIQVLLDAAMVQMNQYTQVISSLQTANNMPFTLPRSQSATSQVPQSSGGARAPSSSSPASAPTHTPSLSATLNSPSSPSNRDVGESPPDKKMGELSKQTMKKDEPLDLSKVEDAEGDEGAVGFTPKTTVPRDDLDLDLSTLNDDLADVGDVNEIRRRRLHRFSIPTTNTENED